MVSVVGVVSVVSVVSMDEEGKLEESRVVNMGGGGDRDSGSDMGTDGVIISVVNVVDVVSVVSVISVDEQNSGDKSGVKSDSGGGNDDGSDADMDDVVIGLWW